MNLRHVVAALVVFAAAGVFALPQAARAEVEIKVDQGIVEPLPVAVPAFTGSTRGAEMAQVITGNLERSGLFSPVNPAAFPEHNLDIGIQPDFAGWKAINAQALVNGAITVEADGKLRGRLPPVGRVLRRAAAGPAVHLHAGKLAPCGAQDQ
jgi:TolB protein